MIRWTMPDSNRPPLPCHGSALPNELMAQTHKWHSLIIKIILYSSMVKSRNKRRILGNYVYKPERFIVGRASLFDLLVCFSHIFSIHVAQGAYTLRLGKLLQRIYGLFRIYRRYPHFIHTFIINKAQNK